MVYISLLHPKGTVKKYTKVFKKAVGYNDNEIFNQNIREFMPIAFASHHDQYLNNFIERGISLNHIKGRMQIVKAENRFLVVKNKQKFIFPVGAKIRLDNYSTEDFGASALISPINLNYHYLIPDA